jgi:hypothetical protein
MARTTSKFDAEPVLHGLKEFQRNTADFVFKRLYQDDPPAHRFLLADEVGLGKTVVAAGVIARAIEHLQKAPEKASEKSPGRIDILYICSNPDIARQNIRRLNVTGDRSVEMASRITLLPLVLDQLTGQKVNFISFTPSTSFDLHGGTGVAQERALLFKMLAQEWGLKRSDSGTLNLLRATSEKRNFAASVDRSWNTPINPQITRLFLREVQRQKLKVRFDALHADFRRVRKNVPADLNRKRNQLISDLQGLLAQACLKALQPKLIILDEFQRFKHLLDPESAPGQLAGDLFEYVGRQSKNSAARVLLLSATP